LGTTEPKRENAAGDGAKKTSTFLVVFRFPRSWSARISLASRMRRDRGRPSPPPGPVGPTCRPPSPSDVPVPSSGDGTASPGLRACSFSRGTRAC
jgi:hypothetical protein